MSTPRPGTCGMPGPYGQHCTEPPLHRFSCYDAGADASFNAGTMQGVRHECADPTCEGDEAWR